MSIIPVWNLFRIGGLLPGLSAEDIRSGISQPRNRRLAEIFHRLKLIESYGTGIRKIFALYKDCAVQPKIDVTQNTFKMILPNRNADMPEQEVLTVAAEKPSTEITSQMKNCAGLSGGVSGNDGGRAAGAAEYQKTRAYLLARQMSENGLIDIIGRGAGKKYKLK